jgi:prepilin-type N-terminal cleavage/methylation domain-containing protein
MKKAFTLLEVLMVVGLTAIVVAGGISFSNNTLLSANFNTTVSDMRQAIFKVNNLALESYNNDSVGIHYAADEYVIFSGTSYDALDESNEVFELSGGISISNIDFNSSANLIFSKSTGIPVNSGSFDITSNKGDSATISIDVNGVTSVSYN